MSYRDTVEALRARRAALEAQLTDARAAQRESEERAKQVSSLERELRETDRMLGGEGSAKRFLDTVQVAAPCTARWEDMRGNDQVRYCALCSKNVYNLSALSRDEAEAFVREREGSVCIRLYRRADGTTITSDCPVGVRRRQRRRVAAGAVAAGALAASALSGAFTGTSPSTHCPIPSPGTPEMGALGPVPLHPTPSPRAEKEGSPRENMGEMVVPPTVPAPPKTNEKPPVHTMGVMLHRE
jgi:hypothetical protein